MVDVKSLKALKDLQGFKANLDKFIISVKGGIDTVISVKAGDLYAILALAEKQLTPKVHGWAPPKDPSLDRPVEPVSHNTPYLNQVISSKGTES